MKITRIDRGQTNKIWMIDVGNLKVILRLYGKYTQHINRTQETLIIEKMESVDIGPKVVAYLDDYGRIEKFINGIPLTPNELLCEDVAKMIAKMHSIEIDTIPKIPSIYTQIQYMYNECVERNIDVGFIEYTEIDDDDIVLCHNDINSGNVLNDSTTSKMYLIDYEYSNYNYRCYDLANILVESCIDNNYDGENGFNIDNKSGFDKYRFKKFLQIYIEQTHLNTTVDEIYKKISLYIPITNVFWGLWALLSNSNTDNWNYKEYARQRILFKIEF